ncbi:heterokaryon incompatibility protein [Polyplosphaeria fusca]|uniref:Heterokaryon incompatibility protein n=1 Tax=Polyplosphaeria fusca TaxID=682080 RepID=A0A9P4V4B5_9PLEO|nr:heterokaryon incompatibility protein [Polyplosphaeria fusca]
MDRNTHPTTYDYKPLESSEHIRLIQILDGNTPQPNYRIVHKEIPPKGSQPDFEAVSYTWGNQERVASLHLDGDSGQIGLTKNLSQALSYLTRRSTTGYLWIDQICIKQDDDSKEKSQQIRLMARIYKVARRVIIWLGLKDDYSDTAQLWLEKVGEMLRGMENSDYVIPGNEKFDPDDRFNVVRSSFFTSDVTYAKYAPALRKFFSRPWFGRGWVVQELLLASAEIFLVGDAVLSRDDMADLVTIYTVQPREGEDVEDTWNSYGDLIDLKLYPFTDEQPLRFLRLMYSIAHHFQTSKLEDQLYAFLGMIEGSEFTPNYDGVSMQENFIRFAVTLAQQYGSLDFLSLWSANLDMRLPNTPKELKGLPSWVPSWTATPLSAPFRLATGGVHALRSSISWKAAGEHRHDHDQPNDAVATRRLHVRGKIIDRVKVTSDARFPGDTQQSEEFLNARLAKLQLLPGLDGWRVYDMVDFLNQATSNGGEPRYSTDVVLGIDGSNLSHGETQRQGYSEPLRLCLAMGYGRRFMRTTEGRLGLAPWEGTKDGESVIAIVYGCSVPIMLNAVDEEKREYEVIGDCYVEGIMRGEAVDEVAEAFVLV